MRSEKRAGTDELWVFPLQPRKCKVQMLQHVLSYVTQDATSSLSAEGRALKLCDAGCYKLLERRTVETKAFLPALVTTTSVVSAGTVYQARQQTGVFINHI